MTTPAEPDAFHAQAYERDELAEALIAWASVAGVARTTVTIELDDAFPHGPPVVRLSERHQRPADPLPTFHLERTGALCLYDDQVEVYDAGWRDPDRLLDQIAGWLEQTAAGWPGDTDTDLERYLPQASGLLRYDADELHGKVGALRLDGDRVRWVQAAPAKRQGGSGSRAKRNSGAGGRRAGRRHQAVPAQGGYLVDAGTLREPLRTWPQVLAAAGARGRRLDLLVRQRSVRVVVVHYSRNGHPGVLALAVAPSSTAAGGVALTAMEAADVSMASRVLRAGRSASVLSKRRVAIVGCGAVGSYVADLLFRSGVHRLTLIDHQILRPGNVVRHVAADRESGRPKVEAVRSTLAATGLPIERVHCRTSSLRTLRQASELQMEHDLVIDASGDQRAAALLLTAALDAGNRLIKVCLQREGGVARVDRWPLLPGEAHAPSVPSLPGLGGVRERGCGDMVSLTPPHAVVTAAAHAVRTAVALLTRADSDASVVDVLSAQADRPYDRRGPMPQSSLPDTDAPTPAPEVTPPPDVLRLERHDSVDDERTPAAAGQDRGRQTHGPS